MCYIMLYKINNHLILLDGKEFIYIHRRCICIIMLVVDDACIIFFFVRVARMSEYNKGINNEHRV